MKKIILDFIQELLISDRIPYHFVSFPCADWDWFDFGLRSKILGLENLSLNIWQTWQKIHCIIMWIYSSVIIPF